MGVVGHRIIDPIFRSDECQIFDSNGSEFYLRIDVDRRHRERSRFDANFWPRREDLFPARRLFRLLRLSRGGFFFQGFDDIVEIRLVAIAPQSDFDIVYLDAIDRKIVSPRYLCQCHIDAIEPNARHFGLSDVRNREPPHVCTAQPRQAKIRNGNPSIDTRRNRLELGIYLWFCNIGQYRKPR